MSELNNLLKRVIKDKGNFVSMEKAAELLIELEDIQHQLEIQTKRVEKLKKVLDFAEDCMSEHCRMDEDCDHCQVKQWKQAIDQELEKQLEGVK